jgi:hypothetical protein
MPHEKFLPQWIAELSKDPDPGFVLNRSVGDGEVQYLPSNVVLATLHQIFGPGAWEPTIISGPEIIYQAEAKRPVWNKKRGAHDWEPRFHCAAKCNVRITITNPNNGLVSVFEGAGSYSMMTKPYNAHDALANVTKAAASNAWRRAASKLGRRFGLALRGEIPEVEAALVSGTADDAADLGRAAPEPELRSEPVTGASACVDCVGWGRFASGSKCPGCNGWGSKVPPEPEHEPPEPSSPPPLENPFNTEPEPEEPPPPAEEGPDYSTNPAWLSASKLLHVSIRSAAEVCGDGMQPAIHETVHWHIQRSVGATSIKACSPSRLGKFAGKFSDLVKTGDRRELMGQLERWREDQLKDLEPGAKDGTASDAAPES